MADRARGTLRASARTYTSSDDEAHSEANRKAASKKAAKKPHKVGGKLGGGRFVNKSRGGVVVNDSSDKDSDGETITDRDRVALRTLANDRNLRGTTAFRLCQAATAAKARPGWSGTGPHYTAWLNALGRTPPSPEAALGLSAPELAYLAMMNGEQEFPVLHNVHRWIASERGGAAVCTTALWHLKKGDAPVQYSPTTSFCRRRGGATAAPRTANERPITCRRVLPVRRKDNDFHLRPVPPPSNYPGSTVTMGGHLIPISAGLGPVLFLTIGRWAHVRGKRHKALVWREHQRNRGGSGTETVPPGATTRQRPSPRCSCA